MTLEEAKAKIKEIGKKLDSVDYCDYKQRAIYYKQLQKLNNVVRNYEYQDGKAKGLYWDYDEWITHTISKFSNSMEEARQDLLDKIKNLHGVKVTVNKSGVKVVEVKTKNKTYTYGIHAHYCSKKTDVLIPSSSIFGKSLKYQTIDGFCATLERVHYGG